MAINIFGGSAGNILFTGLSSDTKPSSPATGWLFIELDTGKSFRVVASVWTLNALTGVDLLLTDVTTNNASTSMHGFLKKLSNTATEFMDGQGNWDTIKDSDLAFTDITTNNGSISAHGFLPKGSNNGSELRDDNTWGFPTLVGRVIGSNVTRTAQTLADITGLSVALLATATYEFEAGLFVTSSSTAGNQYGIQHSNSSGASLEAGIGGTLAAATARFDNVTAFNTAASAMVTVAANGYINVRGVITTNGAGNLTIQHLKTTSGTSTVKIKSFLICRRLA